MTQITNSYLQITCNESNLIDNSITVFEYVKYLPRDSNNMNKDGQYIFKTKDKDVFLLPQKTFLEIRGKLQINADANYNNHYLILLVNNGWSLFQTDQYQLNNQTIKNINLYLLQASTILNLVSFSDDYSKSTASNMLWNKDTGTGGVFLQQNFTNVAENANANAVHDGVRKSGNQFRALVFIESASSFDREIFNPVDEAPIIVPAESDGTGCIQLSGERL